MDRGRRVLLNLGVPRLVVFEDLDFAVDSHGDVEMKWGVM